MTASLRVSLPGDERLPKIAARRFAIDSPSGSTVDLSVRDVDSGDQVDAFRMTVVYEVNSMPLVIIEHGDGTAITGDLVEAKQGYRREGVNADRDVR